MDATLLIVSLLLLAFSVGFTKRYAHPSTRLYVILILSTSFFLGFYGSLLLPVDLAATNTAHNGTSTSPSSSLTSTPYSNTILNLWYFFYWSTFVLSWVILPVVQTYLESGFITKGDRLRDATKSNFRYYAIATGISVFLIVVLSISEGEVNVLPLLMAIGNTYGLLLICLLLGYGLVDVPRQMYRQSKPFEVLRRSYVTAPMVDADLYEGEFVHSSLREIQLTPSPTPPRTRLVFALGSCSHSTCVRTHLVFALGPSRLGPPRH